MTTRLSFPSKGILDIFYLSFLVLCLLFYYIDIEGTSYSVYKISFVLFLSYVFMSIYKGYKSDRNIYGSFVSATYVILLSLFIVNFQTIVNVLLGLGNISYYLETDKYNSVFGKVFFLSIIAVISFLRGNLVEIKNTSNNKRRALLYSQGNFWIFLTFICFCLFLKNIDIVEFLTGVDYKGSGAADREISDSSYWETLFDVFNTISICLYTHKNSKNGIKGIFSFLKCYPLLLLITNLLYLVLRTLSGDRGPLIYTLLLFFFSYIYLRKDRIRNIIILLLLVFAAFSMSTLNIMRNLGGDRDLSNKIEYALNERDSHIDSKSISPSTQELASSALCNFISVYDIYMKRTDYKCGEYNFYELLGGIPGSNFVYSNLFGESFFRKTTSEYVTISYSGKNYDIGLGTTAITDFFMDFGPIGLIICFFLLGIVFKKVDVNLTRMKGQLGFAGLLITLKLASMSIYIPRASLSFVLSKAIYALIIWFVIDSMFNTSKKICKSYL